MNDSKQNSELPDDVLDWYCEAMAESDAHQAEIEAAEVQAIRDEFNGINGAELARKYHRTAAEIIEIVGDWESTDADWGSGSSFSESVTESAPILEALRQAGFEAQDAVVWLPHESAPSSSSGETPAYQSQGQWLRIRSGLPIQLLQHPAQLIGQRSFSVRPLSRSGKNAESSTGAKA